MSLMIKGKTAHVAPRKKPATRVDQTLQKKKTSESVEQEMANAANLTDQYATSLIQQVQLLQIENNYLKQHHEKQVEYNFNKEVPQRSTTHILSRGNEVSLNGRTWCQLPPYHPSIQSIISERSNVSNTRSRQTIETTSRDRRDYSVPCVRSSSIPERQGNVVHVTDPELLHELEESENRNALFEKQAKNHQERIDDQQKVINSLTARITDMETFKLQEFETANNEKRALMEELLELQKRIDELTPVIAGKEMKISQVENEKLELTKRLRIANSDISNLQITISQLREELAMRNNKMKQTLDEMKYIEDKTLVLDSEIREFRLKEHDYQDRIAQNAQQIRELELTKINDKKLIDQLMEENGTFIKENARVTTRLTKLEEKETALMQREVKDNTIQNEVIMELKSALQTEKNSVQMMISRNDILKQKCEDMERSLQDRDQNEEDHMTEKHRVDKELNALHALSKSLSSENKLLREEKLANEEIIDELRGKVRALEANIRSTQEIFSEKEKQSSSRILEMEEDAMRRHQKYLEFEELSKTLHQITSLLPSKTSSLTQDCIKK